MQYTNEKFEGGKTGQIMPATSCTFAEAKAALESESEGFSIRAKNGGPLSFEWRNVLTITGDIKKKIVAIGDASIIKMFDKTPYPANKTDVVCPHFMELKWANGCNFDCSWCYLNGTMRFRPMGKLPYLKDKEKIISHIKEFMVAEKTPTLLNSGELSDSLVYEGNGFSLTKNIIPFFKSQKKHKLLILTKSTNVKGILNSESQDTIIVSFSVNALPVAKKWEIKAPSPELRLKAAKQLADAGYEVRLRIDPMVPIDTWKKDYTDLVDLIYENLKPTRITLGSLRGLQSTINFCEDTSWVKYLGESSNWGLKAPDDIRLKMYSKVMDKVYEYDSKCPIALCKETVGMWEEFSNWKKIKCNCTM
jgi:spore photoproduct lyase